MTYGYMEISYTGITWQSNRERKESVIHTAGKLVKMMDQTEL